MSQPISHTTILVISVVIASIVTGAAIVFFTSPESIQFASLRSDRQTATALPTTAVPPTSAPPATFTTSPTLTAAASATFTASHTTTASLTPTSTATHTGPPSLTPSATFTRAPSNTPSLTPTLPPTETPLPANIDRAEFVTDVTVPDGTEFGPGTVFTKTWRIKNVGTSTWNTGYTFEFAGGAKMVVVETVALPGSVPPGETVDISVDMIAPSVVGNKVTLFQFRNGSGEPFGVGANFNDFIYVQINVVEAAAVPN